MRSAVLLFGALVVSAMWEAPGVASSGATHSMWTGNPFSTPTATESRTPLRCSGFSAWTDGLANEGTWRVRMCDADRGKISVQAEVQGLPDGTPIVLAAGQKGRCSSKSPPLVGPKSVKPFPASLVRWNVDTEVLRDVSSLCVVKGAAQVAEGRVE